MIMNAYLLFLLLFVFILVVDFVVLNFVLKDFFAKELKEFDRTVRPVFAIGAWLLMAVGIYIFIGPLSQNYQSAALYGAIFGLVLYGVYDFTNYAILAGYTSRMVIVDMLWGTILCTASSVFLFFMKNL
jgi:uncharacterized membrane protein